MKEVAIDILGEQLILTAHRAVFWPAASALIFSDLHLGKTAHFRKHGIPVPSKVQQADLDILTRLLAEYRPQQLIIVGDMFHRDFNGDINSFANWRKGYPQLKITLVKGNHDRLKDHQYLDLNIEVCTTMKIGEINFTHEGLEAGQGFYICGHVHPGIVLQGRARQSLRLPCYVVSDKHLILPAFSRFTGLDTSTAFSGDYACYALGNEKVYRV